MVRRGQPRTEKYKAYEAANRLESKLKKEGHDPPRASAFHYQRVGRAIFDEGGDLQRDDPFRQRFDRFPSKHVAIGYHDAQRATAIIGGGLDSPAKSSTRRSQPRYTNSPYAPTQAPQQADEDEAPVSSETSDFEDAQDEVAEASKEESVMRRPRPGNSVDQIAANGSKESSPQQDQVSPRTPHDPASTAPYIVPSHDRSTTDTRGERCEQQSRQSDLPASTASILWPMIGFPPRNLRRHAHQLDNDIVRVQAAIEAAQEDEDDADILDCFESFAKSTSAFINKALKADRGAPANSGGPRHSTTSSTVTGSKRSHDEAFRQSTAIDIAHQSLEQVHTTTAKLNLTSIQKRIVNDPELGATKKALLLLICEVDRGKVISSQALMELIHDLDGICVKSSHFRDVISRQTSNGAKLRECRLCRHEKLLHEIIWDEHDDYVGVPLHRVSWEDRTNVPADAELRLDFAALVLRRGWAKALRDERMELAGSDGEQDQDDGHEQDTTVMYVDVLEVLPLQPQNGCSLEDNILSRKAKSRLFANK